MIRSLVQWLASRPRRRPCTTVVLHATAGSSLAGALKALRDRELSYNFIIEKSGQITKCAPYTRVAFHAGKSSGPEGANVNEYSIGISFVNLNDGSDPYTEAQIRECDLLIRDLKAAMPSLVYLTTHYAISPGRKNDPKRFPVSMVNGAGLQMWRCK